MMIRILEDGPDLKKGVVNVAPELAMRLISQGFAVRVAEKSTDKEAEDKLREAKNRDEAKD
jgi:hypothetical protein